MNTDKMTSEVFNIDCLEYMRTLPDKAFQLAIADPPYGIDADRNQMSRAGTQYGASMAKCKDYGASEWDKSAPDREFFDELLRVCKNVILWGANHYIESLPRQNASCWIVWDKDNGDNGYADCELAWTSLPCAVRRFRYKWHGMLQENMANKEERIHPTQKPVELCEYLIQTYTNEGEVVADICAGSGTTAVAALNTGRRFICFENAPVFSGPAVERIEQARLAVAGGGKGV